MPKKKTTTVTEILPDDGTTQDTGNPNAGLIDDTLDFADRIAGIRERLGSNRDGIIIKVYRILPGKNPSFCFSDADADEEKIQRRCGAGDYLCNVTLNGKVLESIEVSIDKAAVDNAPSAGTPANVHDVHIQMLQQQNSNLMQMVTTMLQNNGNGKNDMGSLIEALAGLKKLSGIESSENLAVKMMEKGMDLALKMTGQEPKSWTTELFDTVKEVARPMVPVLMQHLSNGGATPVNVNEPQPNGVQMLPADPQQQLELKVKAAINELKQKALQGIPVSLVVDWIASNATEYADIIRFVVTSDFRTIATLDNDVANSEHLTTWFKNLYDGLRQSYTESSTMDDDPDGEGGDGGDVASNVSVIPSGKPNAGNPKSRANSR